MRKTKALRTLSLLLVCSMIISGCSFFPFGGVGNAQNEQKSNASERLNLSDADNVGSQDAGAQTDNQAEGDDFKAEFKLDNKWDSGFQVNVVLKSTGNKDMNNWVL
ncbi:MAG: hypothetical protein IJS24_04210, partial [Eubacterium sp.]|nr:hypothetical protein [Eubacterium sp.]